MKKGVDSILKLKIIDVNKKEKDEYGKCKVK